ncbi:MAG: hypothetical protein KA290_07870, partial [Chitinophagaceae bacterium]|nr:hypothetical protein [Chitinophagaceae bacterium]
MFKLRSLSIILFFCSFLFIIKSYGQQNITDSLRTVIDKKSSDNITLPLYYDIAKQYYLIGKQDSGLIYLKKGLAVAELTKNKEWYCKIGLRIGLFYALMSDADSANKYLEVAEPYKMGILNDTILAYYINPKAIVAINKENYEAGASYTIKT